MAAAIRDVSKALAIGRKSGEERDGTVATELARSVTIVIHQINFTVLNVSDLRGGNAVQAEQELDDLIGELVRHAPRIAIQACREQLLLRLHVVKKHLRFA